MNKKIYFIVKKFDIIKLAVLNFLIYHRSKNSYLY
jgi:hypothetical protein